MKKIKFLLVGLLSLLLIFTISTAVLADNETDDPWTELNNTNVETNTDNNTIIVDDTTNNTVNEENNEDNDLYNYLDNNEDNTDNSTGTNAENLADTGLNDSKGAISLIIVISAIVATYSAIKMREYNNL